MKWRGIGYRAHDPAWAWQPLSGDGAAAKGGRFNPVGTPALYLALTIEGMFLEVSHGFGHRFDPLTVCSYNLHIDGLIDLRTEAARGQAGVSLENMACAWAMDVASGNTPASWCVAERLIAGGAAGILVPSFARGARQDMTNLVVWRWGPKRPYQVTVHDPSRRLAALKPKS